MYLKKKKKKKKKKISSYFSQQFSKNAHIILYPDYHL